MSARSTNGSWSICQQIALEVGVNPNMLTRWMREADAGWGTLRDEERARRKRELSRVTRERDFVKGAAAHFAKQSPSGTR